MISFLFRKTRSTGLPTVIPSEEISTKYPSRLLLAMKKTRPIQVGIMRKRKIPNTFNPMPIKNTDTSMESFKAEGAWNEVLRIASAKPGANWIKPAARTSS